MFLKDYLVKGKSGSYDKCRRVPGSCRTHNKPTDMGQQTVSSSSSSSSSSEFI